MKQNLKDLLKAFSISFIFIIMATAPILFNSCGSTKVEIHDKNSKNPFFREHIHEGCIYLEAHPESGWAWGLHSATCPNHKDRSLNADYNPKYDIFAVKTDSIFPIYTVHYTYEGDTAQFIGSIEKCMTFGFDANDVVLWSNL